MIQWLGLGASNAVGMSLIPGQGTRVPHAMQFIQKNKKEKKKKKERESLLILPNFILLRFPSLSTGINCQRPHLIWFHMAKDFPAVIP